jgi:hypothetical protein
MVRGVKKNVNIKTYDFNSITPIEGIQLFEEPSLTTGEIYMITCLKNNKKYIGKSDSFVTKKNIRQGTHGRFVRHLNYVNSLKHSNDIPLLYKDIREYGETVFQAETLYICNISDLQKSEEYMINLHKTFNDNIGYNLNIGNKKPKDEIHIIEYNKNKELSNINRSKDGLMKQSDESKKLPPNISIFKQKNIPVGFKVELKRNNILKSKTFSSAENTMEEKLQMAIKQKDEFLNEFNESNTDEINNITEIISNISITKNDNKNANKLPQGISLRKNKKGDKYIGYLVNISRSGVKKSKNVTSFDTMEKNLEEAIKLKELYLKEFEDLSKINDENLTSEKEEFDENEELPKYICLYKNRQKIISGYRVDINYNNNRERKLFANKNVSMKTNLEKAIKFKEQILKDFKKINNS